MIVNEKPRDTFGDLSLIGMPVIGHIVAHKSGHNLNAQMVSKLLNSPQNWIVVGSTEDVEERHQERELQLRQAML